MDSLKDLLKGIDELENESPEGWWETSKGADFGALILSGAIKIEQQLQQENAALKAELEAVDINKIKADAIREAVSQPNWNELDDGSIFYRESDLLEYANKIEDGE